MTWAGLPVRRHWLTGVMPVSPYQPCWNFSTGTLPFQSSHCKFPWRVDSSRFHLLASNLQASCSDETEMGGYLHSSSNMAVRRAQPLSGRYRETDDMSRSSSTQPLSGRYRETDDMSRSSSTEALISWCNACVFLSAMLELLHWYPPIPVQPLQIPLESGLQ